MTTMKIEWQIWEFFVSCFPHLFMQWYLKPIANLTNYLLSENEDHMLRGMQHIILCQRLSICNNISSAIAKLTKIPATILTTTPTQLLTYAVKTK